MEWWLAWMNAACKGYCDQAAGRGFGVGNVVTPMSHGIFQLAGACLGVSQAIY
jgi:hypothetical protein